jgi:hypothetical protein
MRVRQEQPALGAAATQIGAGRVESGLGRRRLRTEPDEAHGRNTERPSGDDLVRVTLILYPQQDSNPRCRLGRANQGLTAGVGKPVNVPAD